jgi:hypothetical protein
MEMTIFFWRRLFAILCENNVSNKTVIKLLIQNKIPDPQHWLKKSDKLFLACITPHKCNNNAVKLYFKKIGIAGGGS